MPELFIIAGPNGAGKSTFSANLLPSHVLAFDADKELAKREQQYPDIESWRLMEGIQEYFFTEEKENAIRSGKDFAYETNFTGPHAMRTAEQFRQSGYRINIFFLGLDSIEIAKERVNLRVRKGGHNVSTPEIISRYNDGLSNLGRFIDFFDRAVIFTNTKERGIMPPRKVYTLQKGQILEQHLPIPKWLKHIAENLQKQEKKKEQKIRKRRKR